MLNIATLDGTLAQCRRDDIGTLRDCLRGHLILAGGADYEAARRVLRQCRSPSPIDRALR
jgi:hypothetical protein